MHARYLLKEPVWQEIGTHIGTVGRQVTPTNISDGLFYVPLLQTLETMLNNSSVFLQVWLHVCIASSTLLTIMYRLHLVCTNLLVNYYWIYVTVVFVIPTVLFVIIIRLFRVL